MFEFNSTLSRSRKDGLDRKSPSFGSFLTDPSLGGAGFEAAEAVDLIRTERLSD